MLYRPGLGWAGLYIKSLWIAMDWETGSFSFFCEMVMEVCMEDVS